MTARAGIAASRTGGRMITRFRYSPIAQWLAERLRASTPQQRIRLVLALLIVGWVCEVIKIANATAW